MIDTRYVAGSSTQKMRYRGKECVDGPLYVINMPADSSEQDCAAARADWNNMMGPNPPKCMIMAGGATLDTVGGFENRGKPTILEPDGIDVSAMGDAVQQMLEDRRPMTYRPPIDDRLPEPLHSIVMNDDFWLNVACAALWLASVGFWIVRWWG